MFKLHLKKEVVPSVMFRTNELCFWGQQSFTDFLVFICV